MQIIKCTAWGEQHGLIATLPNAVSFDDFKGLAPEHREKMRKQKKEDDRMVKIRYINHEEQERGRYKQPYVKYAGDPIQVYNLIHDEEYTLPMGLVNEINNMRSIVRTDLQSVDGKDVNGDGTPLSKDKVKRVHECIPMGFK